MFNVSLMLPPTDLSGRTEMEIVDDQWRWWARIRDWHTQNVELMLRNDKFYRGDQWEAGDLEKLREEGRPALTINMVLSTVNTLIGEHATKRAQVGFEPSRGGAEGTSACLHKLWEIVENRNGFFYEEQEVFANGLVQRRGWFDARVEVCEEQFTPVIRIRSMDPTEIVFDPDAKRYSMEDWSFVGRTWFASLDDIITDYGVSEDQVSALMAMGEDNAYGVDAMLYAHTTFGGMDSSSVSYLGEEDSAKTSRKRFRMLEREYRVRTTTYAFVDPRTGDKRDVPMSWDQERMHAFAAQAGLLVHRGSKNRIRWVVTAGNVLIHDDWSPYRTFTKRPYFPYFRPGNPFGVVDNLISPQEQLNKIASQELHVINTTANSGWSVPKGSLVNMTTEDLKKHGSQTGVVLEYNPQKGKPEKIQPNQIPAALDRAETKALANLMNISGVNPQSPTREPGKTMNGHTVDFLAGRTVVQNQVVMENLARTREMVVEKFIELVQDFMTAEQVVYMTADMDSEEQLVMNQLTAAGDIINDVTRGTYKAVITMIPARDTYRENQLIESLALIQQGVPIRQERLVMLSSMEDRVAVAQEVAQDLGRGVVPPEVQQMQQQAAMLNFQMLAQQVQELAAKIENLNSDTALNIAKAQSAATTVDVMMSQIEADVLKNRETNNLRQVLAQLSSATRMDQAALNAQARLATTKIKQANSTKQPTLTAPPAAGPAMAQE